MQTTVRVGVPSKAMDESGAGRGSPSQTQPATSGAPADRISSLSDDLLLQVLAHVGYAGAAARTTLLSRRWRDLFSHLSSVDITLRDIPLCSLEDALRCAARPSVRLLDIVVHAHHRPTTISSVLYEAARLSPVQLRFTVPPNLTISPMDRYVPVDLPSFPHATSIDLHTPPHLRLTHSSAHTGFPLLESLSLSDCLIDLDDLIPRCPRLRVLTVAGDMPGSTDFSIQSFSLQGLVVNRISVTTQSITVQAPMLERLTMSFHANRELSVSMLVPMVEKVSWRCTYSPKAHRLGLWDLMEVILETFEGTRHWAACSNTVNIRGDACSQPPRTNVLTLCMSSVKGSFGFLDGETRFAVEISKHVVTDFSALELRLRTSGHKFGSFVWRLLGMHHIHNAIRSLRIVLLRSEVRVACEAACPCDAAWSWRTQPVSLRNLEKLEIQGFEGEDHEFKLLKLMFRHARKLARVTVNLPDQVTPNGDWCTKLYDIFAAYPSVVASVDIAPGN